MAAAADAVALLEGDEKDPPEGLEPIPEWRGTVGGAGGVTPAGGAGQHSTHSTPSTDDASMSGVIAVAACEIRSGDLAGYYPIIVPGEEDLFVFDLATATNPSIGAALYYSTSQALATSGSNVIGYVASSEHYPKQGFKSVDGSPDAGTTIPNITQVVMTFKKSVSYQVAIAV
jgi:hypothetical protein